MAKKYSLREAMSKVSEARSGVKTTAERHAELERAGMVHRVDGTPGEQMFPLGVRRPGALKRFLEER